MLSKETIGGVPISEELIASWTAETEAGIDVEALKKRGRGRPGRAATPSQTIAVRLTAEELALVDASAKKSHTSRSEFIREAIMRFHP